MVLTCLWKCALHQVSANLTGMLISGLAIWTTSLYQIWAGSKQKEFQVRAQDVCELAAVDNARRAADDACYPVLLCGARPCA
jgi:hypothetical protein